MASMTAMETDMQPPVKRRWGRYGWRLWATLFNLLVLGGGIFLWERPICQVREIVYDGPAFWEESARALVTIPADSNFLHVNLDGIETALSKQFGDGVEIRAKLRLPDELCVRLRPVDPELWTATRSGLAADGLILKNSASQASCPIWRSPFAGKSRILCTEPWEAAASWAEVVDAEPRFRDIVSEWNFAPLYGWQLRALDGRTRVILGRTEIRERAILAAEILSHSDSTIQWPAEIDLRFDGRVIIRPLSENPKHTQVSPFERQRGHLTSATGGEGA